MKKLIALLLATMLCLSLVACQKDDQQTSGDTSGGQQEEQSDQQDDIKLAESIKLNIALGNNQRTITYQQATPLTLPDGTVVSQGSLKPTWLYIQDKIGVKLEDVTVQDQAASEMMDVSAATGFKNATVYGGNSIAEQLMDYGAQGYFINLKDYLDRMPNFAKYLEENPDIEKAITAYDGNIYHVPYVAEIGNYARVFTARQSWITTLLDSKDSLKDETATLKVQYEGYWDNRHDKNVIELQNEAATNGVLTRDVALDVLLQYIEETYPELEKPSDLYLGETAKYDIDELVALWRVIKLSPNTLSALETGDVVEGTIISPFFVRKSSYREDVLRLITYFGGQRVHGSDSYASRFYLNEDGELTFSYNEDKFLEGLDYLRDIYAEGLIHSEFSDLNNKDNFRDLLYARDEEEGQKQFGFMTYDWIASTTASNEDVVAVLPPVTTLDSDEFIHFIENTRTIKPDGWAISAAASEEEINAALKLFDFFFTEEGHIVQNYGIPQCLEENEMFTGPDGKEYPKFNQWFLDSANEFKNGDVSAFLRDFIGSLIPIGYQKEIGFEYQYTNERGWEAWALYQNVGVKSVSYGATNPLYKLVPPVFSITDQESAILNTLAINEDQVEAMFSLITGSGDYTSSEQIRQLYIDGGIEEYVNIYKQAYSRMTQ